MSNDTQIKLPGEHGAAVSQRIQYGVRFPDGATAWGIVPGTNLDIEALVKPDDPRHGNHNDGWLRITREHAEAAKIDVKVYRDGHTFIQRTVILAVTATEDVTA